MRYIVQPGDTLYSIARLFGIRTEQIINANPILAENAALSAGQLLEIPVSSRMKMSIDMNGFIDASADPASLQDIFPYLTYLSILCCHVRMDGSISYSNDRMLVSAARSAKVAPMMVVSNEVPGVGYSAEIAHAIISDPVAQQTMLDNIVARLKLTEYYGVNINFELVPYEDYDAFAELVRKATFLLHPMGYYVMLTIRTQRVITYIEALFSEPPGDYAFIADRFIVRSSELACDPVSNLTTADSVQRILDYTIAPFSSRKILIAYPNCCQVWQAPYQTGQAPCTISYSQAALLAGETGFLYDQQTGKWHFTFTDEAGLEYNVWCGNIAGSKEIADLVRIYHLGG
jgi:spore germination protein